MRSGLFLISLLIALTTLGQSKQEVEEHIEAADFPGQAKSFAERLFEGEKIHWIKEQNQDKISYEAKAKVGKVKYSLEFDENGKFEDLEFVIKKKQLPEKVRQEIEMHLNSKFERFKIGKIQEQWSGEKSLLRSSVQIEKKDAALSRRYELVVNAKEKGKYITYEFLFDSEGRLLKSQEVEESNHDNFFY
ncbi:MAG: hypothetical protein RIC95_11380 [Vicingaceae bacterium]